MKQQGVSGNNAGSVRAGIESSNNVPDASALPVERQALTAEEIDAAFDFLPLLSEALDSALACKAEDANTSAQSAAAAARILDLSRKFAEAELIIDRISGGDLSRAMQKERFGEMEALAERKRQFLDRLRASGGVKNL